MDIEEQVPGFISESLDSSGLFGVFEDDGETGYLYLYQPDGLGIITHLHIYNRTADVLVQESDVEVVWSQDRTKCGVRIWGKMRGIINVITRQEGRVWLADRDTPGIGDADWMKGF